MYLRKLLKSVLNFELPISGINSLSEPNRISVEVAGYYIDDKYSIIQTFFSWQGIKSNTVKRQIHLNNGGKIDAMKIRIKEVQFTKNLISIFINETASIKKLEMEMNKYFEVLENELPNPNILIRFTIIKK